jgi:hypothetical protein
MRLNRVTEAVESYRSAILLDPKSSDLKFNLALALLVMGNLSEGWPLYEHRQGRSDVVFKRVFSSPELEVGANLSGKRVLVTFEQGLGDGIHFSRYIRELARRGAFVTLEVPPTLKELMKSVEGVGAVRETLAVSGDFDLHCSLLSIPHLLGLLDNGIDVDFPYLTPSDAKMSKWRALLSCQKMLRVGLAWSGNPKHMNDRNRSIPLAHLASALPLGVEYVSLQKDVRDSDREFLSASGILHYGHLIEDFSDTAAICGHVDLLVTVDTSVAHLAGAMGVPVLLLLPFQPDWRWGLGINNCRWYPSVQLFRQSRPGDWGQALDDLRRHLEERASACSERANWDAPRNSPELPLVS